MPTLTDHILSGSTNGVPIIVSGTNSAGANTIHTAHASALDHIYLYVSNVTGADATLTIEWGSTTDPGGLMCKNLNIPAGTSTGPVPIATGQPVTGGVIVKAFSGTASALNITGKVVRYT